MKEDKWRLYVTPELSTECAGIDLGEFSEYRGSLHHAEQGNLNISYEYSERNKIRQRKNS